jgi:hypothetical protein
MLGVLPDGPSYRLSSSRPFRAPHGLVNCFGRSTLCGPWEIARPPDRPVPAIVRDRLNHEVPHNAPRRVMGHSKEALATALPDYGHAFICQDACDPATPRPADRSASARLSPQRQTGAPWYPTRRACPARPARATRTTGTGYAFCNDDDSETCYLTGSTPMSAPLPIRGGRQLRPDGSARLACSLWCLDLRL